MKSLLGVFVDQAADPALQIALWVVLSGQRTQRRQRPLRRPRASLVA
jgi:hypothetical protein